MLNWDEILEERSKYFDYVDERLRHIRRIWITLPFIILLLLIPTLMAGVILQANPHWASVPQEIGEYLGTRLYEFNSDEFRGLSTNHGLSENRTRLLLGLYYGFYVGSFITLLLVGLMAFGSFKFDSFGKERIAFRRVMRLNNHLGTLVNQPQGKIRKRVIELIKVLDLPDVVSPLRGDWQNDLIFEWFASNPLSKEIAHILEALQTFQEKALSSLGTSDSLVSVRDAVDELATFLYLVNLRGETSYNSPHSEATTEETSHVLVQFAHGINSIQINEVEDQPSVIRFVVDIVTRAINSRVRSAMLIAMLAAILLGIGVAFFDMSVRDAYLAWFMVTIGALTIAIVTTTVGLSRKR